MQKKPKKKITIEEIEKSVASAATAQEATIKTDKTPVKFNKRGKKRKHLKLYITLGVLVVLLTGLGYFGWTLYSSISKVFAGNEAPNLLSMFGGTKLKGESSGRINILLLGIGDEGHDGRYLSDTIMIISYDVKTKQAAMISVPRDLYVKIDQYGSAKINAADAYGEYYKYPGGGPALAEKVISQVLGIPINYYARVDFTGLKDIVDAVGGVDINVTQDLYDPYYPTDDGLKTGYLYIKKGQQHMDGVTALRYSRSRETTSDFDRARRQQQVLVAVKEKVMSANTFLNPVQIEKVAAAIGNHMQTDFSVNEMPHGIDLFKGVDTAKIKHLGFDNSEAGLLVDDSSESAGYILMPRAGLYNYSALQAAVANIFSDNSVKSENATITVLNGTSTGGLAAKAADSLRASGYNIVTVATADSSDYSQTKIIDYTNGAKSATLSALQKVFGVNNATKSSGSPYNTDITVIVGSDYKQ